MISAENTVLILLAAGLSSRFGGSNKLEANFLGRPVGLHVVTALEDVPFKARFVVKDQCSLKFAGYESIANDRIDKGLSYSVGLGVARARALDPDAVLIALADMPRVTATHIYRLLDSADGADAVVVSSDGRDPMPPGVFGKARFDFLAALEGDQGARDLVRAGRHVIANPDELLDIDTPEDLARLRALIRPPEVLTRAVTHRSD